jgi:hypothetical protein
VSHDEEAAARARAVAVDALARSLAVEPRASEATLVPRPLESPGRTPAGWLVWLIAGGRVLGAVQLAVDLTFRRYASFGERAPPAEEWLEPATAAARVRRLLAPGEEIEEVFQSYDSNPDRFAWRVRVRGYEGRPRLFVVAGTDVSERPA